jgi:Domain of unknown function (DUF4184)
MPFTLAHPAAVLPLRRVKYLQTVPLIIGSITPDLPYYVPARIARFAPETHTLLGSFATDIPLGFAVLLCGFLLRRPLTALLGARMRWRCLRSMERFREQPRHWLLVPLSILVGTWTHIAWDSFTHADGWIVRRVAALSAPISIGWYRGEVCHVLQYVSSILGLALLAVWYRRLPSPAPVPEPASAGPRRPSTGLVLSVVLVAAILIGGLQATQYGHAYTTYHLIFLLLTRTMAWFGVLYLVAGTLVTWSRGAEPELQT